MRYGNKSYRTWYTRITKDIDKDLASLYDSPEYQKVLPELKVYFMDSFGSYDKLDYGPHNELAFVTFLMGLFKVGVLIEADLVGTVNHVFNKYLQLTRRLQETYALEPSMSESLWALDDFYVLAYLFGASLLCEFGYLFQPSSINDHEAMKEDDADRFMYFDCIKFVK